MKQKIKGRLIGGKNRLKGLEGPVGVCLAEKLNKLLFAL